jgi:2-dehydro-3-deoxyphosphooctonate aldolase (KDO 8-P synthase)
VTFSASSSSDFSSHCVSVGNVTFDRQKPFTVIAGPCVLESRDHAVEMAHALSEMMQRLALDFVFKASFDKANRTSLSGVRGIGLSDSLPIFEEIKSRFGIPVTSDVHTAEQCVDAAKVIDILQIPAFLSRQTDLLLAAAHTGNVVNIKKGQFLAPWDMKHAVAKVRETGNARVMVTERGASFGYNTLVSDMRSLPIMAFECACPVIFDATHSVQQPGGRGGSSGGQREFVPVLARAAVAVGVAGLFIETHPDPDRAPSDGPNMIPLHELEALLIQLKAIDAVIPK